MSAMKIKKGDTVTVIAAGNSESRSLSKGDRLQGNYLHFAAGAAG